MNNPKDRPFENSGKNLHGIFDVGIIDNKVGVFLVLSAILLLDECFFCRIVAGYLIQKSITKQK